MENPDREKRNSGFANYGKSLRSVGPIIGSGIQLATSVVLMFFLGRWADEKFHTAPWLLIAGIFFGVGAGLYSFIKTAMSVGGEEKGEGRKPG
ncbi:MAG: AtpZ/AtpI family protein [Ignavibacteria bacterium]|nr:MAG: AtpZ/AtpI family protein [Ignavibacteria bacterium]